MGGEYDLLVALLDRANKVLTRDMLLDLLRGRQAGPFDRAIDVAISRLRRSSTVRTETFCFSAMTRKRSSMRRCGEGCAQAKTNSTWSGLASRICR